MPAPSRTVLTTRDGYALHVRCHGRNPVGYPQHSGNRRLVRCTVPGTLRTPGAYWECQGCGHIVPESQVLDEQFAGICDGEVE